MAETFVAIAIGVKLSVFLILLVYSWLVNLASKGHKLWGINIFAISFIIVALIEFFEAITHIEESDSAAGHVESLGHIIGDMLTIIAGVGLIGFLFGVNKNVEKYR